MGESPIGVLPVRAAALLPRAPARFESRQAEKRQQLKHLDCQCATEGEKAA